MENLLIPYEATLSIPCTRALVFAPHPDDEVFGCGGAIMRHVQHNTPVHVIIVSDGTYGVSAEAANDRAIQRQNESIAAAHELGYGIPAFWHYQDRQISYSEKLIQQILNSIQETGADLVYVPSVLEMHPDHRALGMAVSEAVRRIGKMIRVAFYEVGVPLHPNLLLDISDLAARKSAAMMCFSSQNAKQRYDQHIAALNRYRTYTLPEQVTAAEAFMLVSAEELVGDPLKLYASEHTRQKALGLPLDNRDLPLVSVIIRSMDRPSLAEALDSIALQTYPHIEVVVVNAKGPDHSKISEWCGNSPIRRVEMSEPLHRSHAANTGLLAAQGQYLIFLDDDDLFMPEHVATLVKALQEQPGTRCAYTGIRVDYYFDRQFVSTHQFNSSFDASRLWGRNYIPIHAMLFERSLVTEDHCRFDEHLEILEDWDFWIQLSQHTDILHIDNITAIYRNHGHSGLGYKHNLEFARTSRGKIFDKWKTLFTGLQLDDIIEFREKDASDIRHHLADKDNQITALHNRLEQESLASNNREQILQRNIHELRESIQNYRNTIADLNRTIQRLFQSTSWKITAPMRFLIRIMRGQYHEAWDGVRRRLFPLLKSIYWRLPSKPRNVLLSIAYRFAGPLFSGMKHYEIWRAGKHGYAIQGSDDPHGSQVGMINLATITPLTTPPAGRIAIHAHVFYTDLVTEFAKFLGNMPYPYDLFVSTTDEAASQICKDAFSRLPFLSQLTITVVPNRGRDIAPLFCTFGEILRRYDYVAHIHSKKSLYNQNATNGWGGWREYLFMNLLGSKIQIQKIFTLLTGGKNIGLVYPQNFSELSYIANCWLSNKALGHFWCHKLGISPIPIGYFDLPAGSMFWARTTALAPLFEAQIRLEDFPEETGQTDATLAHCIERLLVLVTRRSGYQAIILRDNQSVSWSRWRFEQYLLRDQKYVHNMLADPMVKVVVFDIFDTLLTRPLLDPEKIKHIVAHRAGGEAGKLYLTFRASAESQARQKAGHDIGLDAIFTELSLLSGISFHDINRLRNLEETIEQDIVSPRPEVIALMQFTLTKGKRVVLASDMYLPKSLIVNMLTHHGIIGWHAFYLSSENGYRKDTGDFYQQLLIHENVSPGEVVMIGDNEHSDVQIPDNLGIKVQHVMRPVELARSIPRFGPLVESALYSNDLHRQLVVGMISRSNFHPLFFPDFDSADLVPASPWAIGYTIAGPVALSFVQWLATKATMDGMKRLYFLAREGQILKIVYDQWVSNYTNAVASDYLVLSRRAITVPMISNFDDMLQIARVQYFSNHLSEFIHERYGLALSNEDIEKLIQSGSWSRNRLVTVEHGEINHLVPVLRALENRILEVAQSEHPGLLAYLNKMGLTSMQNVAIVDIGYSATVQEYLCEMTNNKINGYYLMTRKRAEQVASKYNVIAEGYYCQNSNPDAHSPIILRESFSLEKLLSSDDAQIVRYLQSENGEICPEFRSLADEERQSMRTRAEIRRGIMDFVNQSIMIRDKLVGDYNVPADIATDLFEEFILHPSKTEKNILGKLVLDDHYCGRGLVS